MSNPRSCANHSGIERASRKAIERGYFVLIALSVCSLLGCTAIVRGRGYDTAPPADDDTSSSGAPTVTVGGAGGMQSTGGMSGTCSAPSKPLGQRLVRLTFAQLENSIGQLLGPEALTAASVADPRRREFQALFVEGDLVNTQVLEQTVALGQTASDSAAGADNFALLTGCDAAAPDDACANGFLLRFAERAYRRPLTADERASVAGLYNDTKTVQGSVQGAVRSAVLGILTAPETLYRSEFGTRGKDPKTAALTGYELASSLSYFLSDGPPDSALLAAAAAGKLVTSADVGKQVDRMLALASVRQNLSAMMVAYYGLKDLDGTTKDPTLFPEFTVGVRNSMYSETQLFIQDALWHGKLSDLMTSRKTFINDTLAHFYGVTYPAASGTAFLPFEFPAGQRAGILTHGSIMSMRARTDTTSVVSRGLFINGTVLCVQSPPAPPASVQSQVQAQVADGTKSERDKARVRDTTLPCKSCHLGFDPYGLVLENYDAIGRLRARYPGGKPIDTTVVLPVGAGGGTVPDVTGLVEKITQNDVFGRCLTSNLMKYAVAEASLVDINDCNVKQTYEAFQTTEQTFPELIRQIATSKLVSSRVVESTP